MSQVSKRPWAQVAAVATQVADALRPYCLQIEAAGSVRRQRALVGDVELVAVPIIVEQPTLFGGSGGKAVPVLNQLHQRLDALVAEKKIEQGRTWGRLHRQFTFTSGRGHVFDMDLYLVEKPAENWGNILVIRTGSREFNLHLMEYLKQWGLRQSGGLLLDSTGQSIPCPTEEAFFAAIRHPYIPPTQRHDELWRPIVAEWMASRVASGASHKEARL